MASPADLRHAPAALQAKRHSSFRKPPVIRIAPKGAEAWRFPVDAQRPKKVSPVAP